MPWCVIHRITGVPPSVSVVLKIALRSLDGITVTLVYSSQNISDTLTINFLLCASDFIIPWCLTHRITGVAPSVSVALRYQAYDKHKIITHSFNLKFRYETLKKRIKLNSFFL